MRHILTILLLLIVSVANAQNLRLRGSTGSTNTLRGDWFYISHPTFGVSDNLKLTDKQYVDALARITSINSQTGPAITFTGINGLTLTTTTNNLEYKLGGTLSENTTIAQAGFNMNFTGSGNIGIGVANPTGTEKLRVQGRAIFTDTLTGLVVLKAGNFIQGATVAAKIMTDGEVRAAGGFNTVTPTLTGNTFTGLTSNTLQFGNTTVLAFQNVGSNNVAVNQISMTGNYNPASGGANIMNTVYIGPSVVPTGANSLIYNMIRINPIINQAAFGTGITRGLLIDPTLTSAANWRTIETTVGNVMFNTTSGGTWVGTTGASTDIYQRKLYSNGSIGANKDSVTTISSMSTHFVLVMDTSAAPELGKFKKILVSNLGVGGITSINSQTGPAFSIADGSGIDVVTTTNTATINLGGGLTNSPSITGGGNSLAWGTSGSRLSRFTVDASDDIILRGSIVFNQLRAPDANYTVAENDLAVRLPTITANRNLTINFNLADTGKVLVIHNQNTSTSFRWDLDNQIVTTASGLGLSFLEPMTNYIIQLVGVDGGSMNFRAIGTQGYPVPRVSSSGTVTMEGSVHNTAIYVATGTTATYSLPTGATSYVGFTFTVKSQASGNTTVDVVGGSATIYDTSAVTSIVISAGASRDFIWDGTYWTVK